MIMDFKTIQKITDTFIENNESIIDNLDQIVAFSKEVYKTELKETNYDWSRSITINESIEIIYNFLKTIDEDLANQYFNIIRTVNEETNTPYVNFIDSSIKQGPNEVTKDGIVYIYYYNNPDDLFTILHEMLHKMNECDLILGEDTKIKETPERVDLTETVSILGELLLGDYLVENNIITEADFEKRKAWRLKSTKRDAIDFIIENELIKLRMQGIDINRENALEVIKHYDPNSIEREILGNEYYDTRLLYSVLKRNDLFVKIEKRYITAQVLAEDIYKKENAKEVFLKLHNAIASINAETKYDEMIKNDEVMEVARNR